MRRASRFTRVVSQVAVLFGAAPVRGGCGDDTAPLGDPETWTHQALIVARELDAPAPVVQAELKLSPFALEHFQTLRVSAQVNSGQALEQEGVVAHWSSDATVIAAQADFEGALSNTALLSISLASPPCEAAPCLFTLELSPSGDWISDVPFPIEYTVGAQLTLGPPRERGALASDLSVRLRVAP